MKYSLTLMRIKNMANSDITHIAGYLHVIKDDENDYNDLIKRFSSQIKKVGYTFKDDNKFVSDLLDKYKEGEVDHFTDMGYTVEEYFNEEVNVMTNPDMDWWIDLCDKFLIHLDYNE